MALNPSDPRPLPGERAMVDEQGTAGFYTRDGIAAMLGRGGGVLADEALTLLGPVIKLICEELRLSGQNSIVQADRVGAIKATGVGLYGDQIVLQSTPGKGHGIWLDGPIVANNIDVYGHLKVNGETIGTPKNAWPEGVPQLLRDIKLETTEEMYDLAAAALQEIG